jgi:signal transduction histidine kinase
MNQDEVSPSFVLCIIDQSSRVLADNRQEGERQLVALINSTISHEMRNPLNVVINQCQITKIQCEQFAAKLPSFGAASAMVKEFYDNIMKSNTICANSSELLTLNIEDLLTFAQLKSQTFLKNESDFNIYKMVQDVVKMQKHQSDSKKL